MAHPRFLYVRGTIVDDRPVPAWPGLGEPLRGERAADGSWVAWRLLGRNNHELARSVLVFPGIAECAAAARALQAKPALAELRVGPVADGRWVWRVYHDGVYVAVASRSYSRQRECHYSLRQFEASLPDATTGDLRLFDLGRRRLVEREAAASEPAPGRPAAAPASPVTAADGRLRLRPHAGLDGAPELWCPL